MKNILLLISVWAVHILPAQSLQDLEKELAHLGERSIMAITEEERLDKAALFGELLDSILKMDGGLQLDLRSVKSLSVQKSKDGQVCLYTWVVPLKNGEYSHFGRLQTQFKNESRIVELTDKSAEQPEPENTWGKPASWYGAIYFDIQEFKHKKNKYYVLFGYRPENKVVHQKLLDVITIDRKTGEVRFGAKIFDTPLLFDKRYKKRPYRLIFEYSKKVTAMIKWSANEKMIIMDHLSPPDASLQGKWQHYGPDFSYDGLKWEKGKFKLEKDITIQSNVVPPVSTDKPKQGLGN